MDDYLSQDDIGQDVINDWANSMHIPAHREHPIRLIVNTYSAKP